MAETETIPAETLPAEAELEGESAETPPEDKLKGEVATPQLEKKESAEKAFEKRRGSLIDRIEKAEKRVKELEEDLASRPKLPEDMENVRRGILARSKEITDREKSLNEQTLKNRAKELAGELGVDGGRLAEADSMQEMELLAYKLAHENQRAAEATPSKPLGLGGIRGGAARTVQDLDRGFAEGTIPLAEYQKAMRVLGKL